MAAGDALLAAIHTNLAADPRVVAAWLGGSVGRGEDDAYSDLDITVVVDDAHAAMLCARPRMVQAGAPPERLALFERFGRPAIVHENHYNAPAAATFSIAIYADTGQQVDWTLVPRAVARRPRATRLLFDHAGVPLAEPAGRADDLGLAERVAFFWMLTLPAARAVPRGDAVAFHVLLDSLERVRRDVERLASGEPSRYQRGSPARLAATRAAQADALRHAGDRMLALAPEPVADGIVVPAEARRVLEQWLRSTEG